MSNRNVLISFDDFEIGKKYFTFADDAKEQIIKVLNDTSIKFKPFFSFVIKYLLFNKDRNVSLDECRKIILRYALLFVYVAYKKGIGTIKEFDQLINNMSIDVLNKDIDDNNNVFITIYNNRRYNNEFIKKDGFYKNIHSILINDYDFFSESNDNISSYNTNRSSFDLMVCHTAFESDSAFKKFEIELIDSDEYREYITNGQKVNYLVIALILYTLITTNKTKKDDLFKIDSRAYYRIANIGNTSTKIAPIYISFLENDENKGYSKISYSTIKKDLVFKFNGITYALTNKGIIKI